MLGAYGCRIVQIICFFIYCYNTNRTNGNEYKDHFLYVLVNLHIFRRNF